MAGKQSSQILLFNGIATKVIANDMPNKNRMLYLLSVEAISLEDMDTETFNNVTIELISKVRKLPPQFIN